MSVGESRALEGTGVIGAAYLLHFEPPFKHAGRYVGWVHVEDGEDAADAVWERWVAHVTGKGSPLVGAAAKAGCAVIIARIWEGVDRHFERAIKEGKNASRLDPISQGTMTLAEAVEKYHGAR